MQAARRAIDGVRLPVQRGRWASVVADHSRHQVAQESRGRGADFQVRRTLRIAGAGWHAAVNRSWRDGRPRPSRTREEVVAPASYRPRRGRDARQTAAGTAALLVFADGYHRVSVITS